MANSSQQCICLFSSLYHPNVGGVETYTKSLAKALADMGLRVIVVACNTHGMPTYEICPDHVEVLRLPCFPFLNTRFPLPHGLNSYPEWTALAFEQIDYVIVNSRFYPLSLIALKFARSKGIVPVLIEHGSAHLTLGNSFADVFVRMAEHALTSFGKRFKPSYYAVSEKAGRWLEHFGIESKGELHNAIDIDEFTKNASTRDFREELSLSEITLLVGFVGRLVPEKGVIALAEASTLLDGDITIVLAGDGPLMDKLRRFESPSFHLVGRLSRQDTAAFLSQSDVLCLPSRSEGFATTLLESAACQTPPFVTLVGGVHELVPSSEFGTILRDAQPNTIANALRRASLNRSTLKIQGEAVQQRVKSKFNWKETASQALKACKEAQDHH